MKYKAVPVAKFWKLAHSTRPDLFGKAFILRENSDGELVQDFGYAITFLTIISRGCLTTKVKSNS